MVKSEIRRHGQGGDFSFHRLSSPATGAPPLCSHLQRFRPMRGERGFRPKGIVGQKIGLNGGAQFQKMKSHRKKGILRRAHASRRAPVEGNESILRGYKKA